jgi:hypothetical protein
MYLVEARFHVAVFFLVRVGSGCAFGVVGVAVGAHPLPMFRCVSVHALGCRRSPCGVFFAFVGSGLLCMCVGHVLGWW